MSFHLGHKSLERLHGVHPDLVAVVLAAIEISACDFTVLEGLRSEARQRYLVDKGASKTMRSRHITGHAVDLGAFVDGAVSWEWDHYPHIATAMKTAAQKLNIPVEWGGDWASFRDGPHFQLPWHTYPGPG